MALLYLPVHFPVPVKPAVAGVLSVHSPCKSHSFPKYGSLPDIVISGFHLMLKREIRDDELREVRSIAEELRTYQAKFFTCHCTGIPAFEEMKRIMGDQLGYVHSGEEIVF